MAKSSRWDLREEPFLDVIGAAVPIVIDVFQQPSSPINQAIVAPSRRCRR
jgi:hypothetical protein